MTPEALRRRMAHGNVYQADKVDAALGNYFRIGNLTALRELALLWLADKVDEQLDRYRAEHDIDTTWEARERVVVALTGGPEGDTLIRRAARIAARGKGADLLAVHVARDDGLTGADPALLARQRVLVESLGGTYHQVVGDRHPDRPAGLRPRRQRHPARPRRQPPRPARAVCSPPASASPPPPSPARSTSTWSPTSRSARAAGRRSWRGAPRCRPRRRMAGFGADRRRPAAADACVLHLLDDELSLPSDILLFLAAVVGVALVGGLWPALLAAVGGSLLLNYFFTPPVDTFTHRRAGERPRPRRLRRHRRRGQRGGRPGRPPHPRGRPGQRRRADPRHRRRQRAARRPAAARAARTAAGDVRAGLGHTAGTPRDAPAARTGSATRRLAGRGQRRRPPCATPGEGDVDVPVDDDVRLVLRGTAAGRRRPAHRRGVRRPGRRRAAPGAAGRRGRPGQAAGRGRPDAHRAARRGQPRPAHPAGLRQGRRGQPAQPRRRASPTTTARNCWPPPRSRSTGSPGSSPTCST